MLKHALAASLVTLLGCTDPLEIGAVRESGDNNVDFAGMDAGATDGSVRPADELAQAALQIGGSWRTTLPLAGPTAAPTTLVLRFDPLDSRPRGGRWSLICEANCDLSDGADAGGFSGPGGSPGPRISPLAIFQGLPINGDYWMLMEVDDARAAGIIRSEVVSSDLLFDRSRATVDVTFGLGVSVTFSKTGTKPRSP